ncbi:MAG: lipid A biosynthesis acyltransferase [Betaproteobacteria bacterium]|nr:lipid A biosynthesis acyltransferase [Betaproteobacteria bacterium]
MIRITLALMWLLHWLPLPVLAVFGRALGLVFYVLVRERRHSTLTNLRLCFPQLSPAERSALARRHLMTIGRTLLELGVWWWASPQRIRRLVTIEHPERLAVRDGRPLILFAPHFAGLEAGGIRLSMEFTVVTVYAKAKNPVFDRAVRRGRERFNKCVLISRREGLKKVLRPLRAGMPFYYLPDMDFGRKESVFVPFFGVPAATTTGMSRLAKATGATVLPVITRMVGKGYVVSIGEPWQDYPTDDAEADARRMNAFLETEVMKSPEQYYWLHKRFKTRPLGEKGVY